MMLGAGDYIELLICDWSANLSVQWPSQKLYSK